MFIVELLVLRIASDRRTRGSGGPRSAWSVTAHPVIRCRGLRLVAVMAHAVVLPEQRVDLGVIVREQIKGIYRVVVV
jgi:hypothetical protein